MKNYNHLDLLQRYAIESPLSAGKNTNEIADTLGVYVPTIHGEVRRNKEERGGLYRAILAENKCATRHKFKHKHATFTPEVCPYVEGQICEQLSPEKMER